VLVRSGLSILYSVEADRRDVYDLPLVGVAFDGPICAYPYFIPEGADRVKGFVPFFMGFGSQPCPVFYDGPGGHLVVLSSHEA